MRALRLAAVVIAFNRALGRPRLSVSTLMMEQALRSLMQWIVDSFDEAIASGVVSLDRQTVEDG